MVICDLRFTIFTTYDKMKQTILIIDDDDVLRGSLGRGLTGAGFTVLDADGAAAASEILMRIRVDAIVLDRMMVGTDGLTFLKNLRTAGDRTPVIMLTAMTGPENAIDGLSGGANDYLAKPFQLRELILRLGNIIGKSDAAISNLPAGLMFIDGEFFITSGNDTKLLGLSGEEKRLMEQLVSPVGNIAAAAPMVAKRLRMKLNSVLSNTDIITVRGRGYKLVCGK
jgi:DNA-binding response OmpR family regulator